MQIMQVGRHFLEGSRLLGFDDQRLSLAKCPELLTISTFKNFVPCYLVDLHVIRV